MSIRSGFFNSILVSFAFVASTAPHPQGLQEGTKKRTELGTHILWRNPADIESRDLYHGPGGASMKPDLSRVALLDDKAGTPATKFKVRDAAGREWVVKTSDQSQAEIAAMRLVWAVGYFTDVTYLTPHLKIPGKGAFENVRLEARPKEIKRLNEWSWIDNPFLGAPELQGLKLLLALLDNWDLKNENNRILFVRDDEAGAPELRYVVSDIDARFDKTGTAPSIWLATGPPKKGRLVAGVKDDVLDFGYEGKHKERLAAITRAEARWITALLARLSENQIKDALRAANYSPEAIEGIAGALRARISELIAVTK